MSSNHQSLSFRSQIQSLLTKSCEHPRAITINMPLSKPSCRPSQIHCRVHGCDRSFATSRSREWHLKKTHARKIFHCMYCDTFRAAEEPSTCIDIKSNPTQKSSTVRFANVHLSCWKPLPCSLALWGKNAKV
jgi:hypothetical protein